tara:strand:- start:1514 stop:2338 length:825 start_codon:yes stop_codon:yes gene_type:complete
MTEELTLTISKTVLQDLIPDTSISPEALTKICDRMPELRRAKMVVGRTNSQTTSTLMTMTMIADSPYRQLKQCLAQIDGKRVSLLEAHFKHKKNKVKIKRWEESGDELEKVEAEEARMQMAEIQTAVENAMKEIGMYQDIYDQIRTTHNIPVDWDEEDFEKKEIEHALRMGFRMGVQNIIATGRISTSCAEYWEQFGVHPMVGEKLVRGYLANMEAELNNNKYPSVTSLHDFLDKMVENFKDEHKHSLARIGVDAIVNHQYAYKKTGASNNGNH